MIIKKHVFQYCIFAEKTMDIQKIQEYKSAFDSIAKLIKDDDENTIEVWYARELQQVLGYARWENFGIAVYRAMESCKTLGINIDDHFREVTKIPRKKRWPLSRVILRCRHEKLRLLKRDFKKLHDWILATGCENPKNN